MRLTPQEHDRLLIFTAAQVARRRLARGLALNVPEAIAIVSDEVIEAARDGLDLPAVVERAQSVLGPESVLPGVADIVTDVSVEAVFDDGTRLVVIPDPVGAGAPVGGGIRPGAITAAPVIEEHDPDRIELEVVNTATVAITVTSHWHFFEANPALHFDRAAAYGYHLDVPAGTGIGFPAATATTVALVPIRGKRVAIGFAGLVDGPLDGKGVKEAALAKAAASGYLGAEGETP